MSDNNKVTESITVKGIAATIQSMGMPTFKNLGDLLKLVGYNLTKIVK